MKLDKLCKFPELSLAGFMAAEDCILSG
jgi:hypothetical protein